MISRLKSIADIIEDDGLINDYEFKRDIYTAGLVEDYQNYLLSRDRVLLGRM